MSGIFISYRRSDTAGYVGRLYPDLVRAFGRDQVFMDIDTLTPGRDFTTALDHAVTTCDVLIALIGPAWLHARDENGNRRLDDPEDWVRQEIAKGLEREDILVIPVLVGDARMPRPAELPDELKRLTRRQAFSIGDGRRWNFDVNILIAELKDLVKPTRSPIADWILRPLNLVATGVLLALTVSLAVVLYAMLTDDDPSNGEDDLIDGPTAASEVAQNTEASGPISSPESPHTPAQETSPTPTDQPTTAPSLTPSLTPTSTATVEPTWTPSPTAMEEPTATEVPTKEPTATTEPTATDVPTEEPTATTEPTATKAPTEEPTATEEPPTATTAPTERPTEVPPTSTTAFGEVLYEDDFDDPDASDFGTYSPDPDVLRFSFDDGAYVIEKIDPDANSVPFNSIDGTYKDVVVMVDAWLVGETEGRYVFVTCRDKGNTYYELDVAPDDSYFRLSRWNDGKVTTLARESGSDAVEPGNAVNQLELHCIGTQITAYVNEVEVIQFDDEDAALDEGVVGLGTGISSGSLPGTVEAQFDNFLVASPPTSEEPTEVPPTATEEPPTATTVPTSNISDEWRAAGLINDQSYESPQFGYTVEWDETWSLDEGHEPPVESNTDDERDRLYLRSADDTSTLNAVGCPCVATTIGELVENHSEAEYVAEGYGKDASVLLADYNRDDIGATVVFYEQDGQDMITVEELYVLGDESLVVIKFTSPADRIADTYPATGEAVSLNDQPVLTFFDIEDITAALEETDENTGEDPTVDEGFSDGAYKSAEFGYIVEWDETWELDEELQDEDGFTLNSTRDYGLLSVEAEASEGKSVEDLIAIYQGFAEDEGDTILVADNRDEAAGGW
jgi:hypothetical protein